MTEQLVLAHVDASFAVEDDGQIDRLVLKFLHRRHKALAYIVAIEPNDQRPFPTEISVKRREWHGPRIQDVDERRISDRDRAFRSEAEAWAEIERLLVTDLLAVT